MAGFISKVVRQGLQPSGTSGTSGRKSGGLWGRMIGEMKPGGRLDPARQTKKKSLWRQAIEAGMSQMESQKKTLLGQ